MPGIIMPMDNRLQRIRADERGIIVGWLGKLAIGFAVVAVLLFDGGSILINFFTLDSTADEIAIKLTTGLTFQGLSEERLKPQAEELAKEVGARLIDLRVER